MKIKRFSKGLLFIKFCEFWKPCKFVRLKPSMFWEICKKLTFSGCPQDFTIGLCTKLPPVIVHCGPSTCLLTLSRPISLHSRKPPGPHCFEPFTCNVYRSFQPHNMHMCKQFWGKVSTAKIFYDYQTYLWFVWFFLQNEHELKIEEIFLPWKAKHTGKIVAP